MINISRSEPCLSMTRDASLLPVRKTYTHREIAACARTVDYGAIVGDAKVVFLGEIHHCATIRKEIVTLLPELKGMEFTG